MSEYPKDEFDLAAEERGPKGVHRRVESRVRRFLPFALVIILGPLLAWGVVSVLNRDSDDGAPQASPTQTEDVTDPASDDPEATDDEAEPTDETTPDTTDEATDEPTEATDEPTDDPEADVNFDAAISVLNGAGTSGLAGRTAEILTAGGFTDVFAGNYQSALPEVSYVYYQSADLQATAQYIADLLGIEPVEELASASNEIVVVLRADFEE